MLFPISELLEDSRPDMDDWMEGPDNNPFGVSGQSCFIYLCVSVRLFVCRSLTGGGGDGGGPNACSVK